MAETHPTPTTINKPIRPQTLPVYPRNPPLNSKLIYSKTNIIQTGAQRTWLQKLNLDDFG
jgi:hypothetical protein